MRYTGSAAGPLDSSTLLWLAAASGPVSALHTLGGGDWRQLLHTVALEGQGLTSLQGLAAAANLSAVSLSDNLITDLQELAACTKLQCLDISSNLVTEVGVRCMEGLETAWQHQTAAGRWCAIKGATHVSSSAN